MIIKFLLLSAAILNFVLGTMIIFGNKERKERLLFAFLSYSMAIWSLSIFLIYQIGSLLFVRLSYSTGLLIIISIVGWLYYYKKEEEKSIKKILPSLFIIFSIFFFFFTQFTDQIIKGIERSEGGEVIDIKGAYFIYYLAFFLVAYAYSLISILRRYRNGNEDVRRQLGLVVIGFSVFAGFGILFGLVMPAIGVESAIDFDAPLSLIFTLFVLISIIHYKWMDVKVFTSQVLTFSIWILLVYQFLWANTFESRIVSGASILLSIIFGIMLIVSVRKELQRKDEIQKLANELAIANEKLHQLDSAKSEFISIASHQLRTPLTSIKGFVSLLLEGTYGPVPQKQKSPLEKVYISNERLIHLVEDLLNISRIESGRLEFDFQPSNIENIVFEVVETLELSAKNKGLYLEVRKPGTPIPKIIIDAGKIKEVISNMVDNAIKYTPKGGVRVGVEHKKTWNAQLKSYSDVVMVVVSDTGIGIDKSEIDSIFEKFRRGKSSSQFHTGGTGLGMYVGKKIIAVHKGRIWAESEGSGKGSRFILELPVKEKHEGAKA